MALAVGLTGLFVVSAGVASASAARVFHVAGPFADQATCAQQAAYENNPPESNSSTCQFYNTNPYTGSGGGTGPGWYYFFTVN